MSGRLLACGDCAVLAEVDDLPTALALYRYVEAHRPPGLADLVLGARTLLAIGRSPADLPAMRDALVAALDAPTDAEATTTQEVALDVVYDGADLGEVAALLGWTPQQVIDAHSGTPWRVAFGGFAPGFAYLTGGDPRLDVPRRSAPRTSVPAGSVGMAGKFSGVYPRSSPGGWQLLGTTTTPLWDASHPSPALLRPGMTVRFRPIAAHPPSPSQSQSQSPEGRTHDLPRQGAPASGRASWVTPDASHRRAVQVTAVGMATVQDAGRRGFAHVGVSASGAADRSALALANRLVGNHAAEAAIEVTLGGLEVVVTEAMLLATTGAHAPARLNGTPVPHGVAWFAVAGDTVRLGRPAAGLRTYLAVSGGLAIEPVLRSRSTDTLSGLGPARLREGDVVPVGPQPPIPRSHPTAPPVRHAGEELVLDVSPGPRREWLADPSALRGPWTISGESDRVGVRLVGAPLCRHRDHIGEELPSEGVVRGAIQVPASGLPVIFGADHPVTGGYPVVGVLTSASSDRLAQARPGQVVALRWAPPRETNRHSWS